MNKRQAKRSSAHSLPRIGDFGMSFYLLSYSHQLEMLLDRLEQHEPPDDDSMSDPERTHLDYARRYMKAAGSSLARLMDGYNRQSEDRLNRGSRARPTPSEDRDQ